MRSSIRGSARSARACWRSRTARCSTASPSGRPCAGGGDLVVNTSQTGYQEVCTDPSYAGQVVVMTYPAHRQPRARHADDDQSERPWLRGLVVGHATAAVLGRARQIVHLLRAEGVPAIAGLDTRALARHLRETGSLRGDHHGTRRGGPRRRGRGRPGRPALGGPGLRRPGLGAGARTRWATDGPLVAVVDYGLKTNIVRSLRRRGARVRVLPHTATPPTGARRRRRRRRALARSGRPGAPRRARWRSLARSSPTAGRCWASASATRSSARAAGAETRRLRFGHHGANHPVRDEGSGGVQVTAQNHEVEVVGDSLPARPGFYVSQRNLNDGSVEGLRHHTLPIETVQYHPEGSPGPLDAAEVFDRFLGHVRAGAGASGRAA